MERKNGFRYALLVAVGTEKLEAGIWEQAYLSDCLGVLIWLSLVGSKLKVGAKIREVFSYELSTGHGLL